jgi:hypothetical protein
MRSSNVLGRTSSARAVAIVTASLMLLLLGGIQVVRADHLPVHGTILARGPFTEPATSSTCRSRRRGRRECRIETGQATVPLFDHVSLIEHPGYATMRLIVLDLPDGGNVLISIDGKQVDAAMPVVRSFAFDLD